MNYTSPKNSRSRKSRILNSRIIFVALAVFALLALVATSAFMAGVSGAVFTTDFGCNGNDLNIYTSKAAVYINGGPAHPGAAGLPNDADTPNGGYYVQVTDPNGTVRGQSAGVVVHVAGNAFVQCYKLIDIVKSASSSFVDNGFDDTANPGGEYKVWVSTVPTFDNDSTKTDNFKVKCEGDDCGGIVKGTLNVIKFYDANTNGTLDPGEQPLTGWKFIIDQGVGARFTPVSTIVQVGDYTVTECSPQETNWLHTSASILTHNVTADGYTFQFGNVCIAGGTGLTLGFWSNPNGQTIMTGSSKGTALLSGDQTLLRSLCLRNANGTYLYTGSNTVPTAENITYKTFNTWILGANASNMANMLSAQLAAMELNVLHTKVSGSSLVYAPCLIGKGVGANSLGFISISDLMTAAQASLCANGNTTAAGALRTYQECLKTALDDANNNRNFVSSTPCAFSNFSCPNN